MTDEFKTISATSEGYYTEKRSKFLAFAHHVENHDEIKPILGQINSNELTDILIVVVRYYGGVNLGTSGLIVAYREAAADALAHAKMELRQVEEEVSYTFTYPQMNDVMRIVKDMNPRIISQTYDNTCVIRMAIRKSEAQQLRDRLAKLL